MRDNFRFVHEPIHAHIADRFVGRSRDLEELVHRIRFSEGGSFLITGYRGVGKSSFVNQVLGKLDQETLLLDVQINLARPIQPSELMHLIVRHLYNRLNEKDIYRHLSSSLKTQLSLAYQRTSANVVRKLSDGREVGIETGEIKTVSLFRLLRKSQQSARAWSTSKHLSSHTMTRRQNTTLFLFLAN